MSVTVFLGYTPSVVLVRLLEPHPSANVKQTMTDVNARNRIVASEPQKNTTPQNA